MTWFRVDDSLPDHPKLESIESDAVRHASAIAAWTLLGADSARRGTDGLITRARVNKVLARWPEKMRRGAVDALVECGLWEAAGDESWRYHDWADYQPSKDEIDSRKKSNAARQKVFREKKAFEAEVIDRDGWRCTYCKTPVTRATVTLDHVVPVSKGGATNAANLVTSCRACNSSKRDKPQADWSATQSSPADHVTRYEDVSNTTPSRPVPSRPPSEGESPPVEGLATRESRVGEMVRLTVADAYKAQRLARPPEADHLDGKHWIAIARWLLDPGTAARGSHSEALSALLGGFFANKRAKERGYPVAFLATINEYLPPLESTETTAEYVARIKAEKAAKAAAIYDRTGT